MGQRNEEPAVATVARRKRWGPAVQETRDIAAASTLPQPTADQSSSSIAASSGFEMAPMAEALQLPKTTSASMPAALGEVFAVLDFEATCEDESVVTRWEPQEVIA